LRAPRILLGVIGRPHGVRGLLHVVSHTADPESLAGYGPLEDDSGRRFVLRWKGAGVAAIAQVIDGREVPVADRDSAARLTNTRLHIDRDRLPAPEEDEFYLADLLGLAVRDAGGARLGTVGQVHDYGGGVSLEIVRDPAPPLLVPFTRAAVPVVDIVAGCLTVVPPQETAPPPRAEAAE
jgi:16S rRNA processing protein RimM